MIRNGSQETLRLPNDISLEEVIVWYQVSNARSYISCLRLSETAKSSGQVSIPYYKEVNLQSTTPASYRCLIGGIVPVPDSTMTLDLQLNSQDTTDQISLGAVAVMVSEQDTWGNQARQWLPISGEVLNVKELAQSAMA